RRRGPRYRTRPRRRCAFGFVAGFAPRDPADPLGGSVVSAVERGDARVGSEHALHAAERTPGPVGRGGITTPEPELATDGGTEVVRREGEASEAGGDRVGEQPGIELPT